MRWCWIDRYLEFHQGSRATAVKNVSLAERQLRDSSKYYPVMPNSLILEGMGQTGMYLACEAVGYADMILLAKVASARFHCEAVPGDMLTYCVSINSIQEHGVSATGQSRLGDRLQGEAELIYARRPGHDDDLREMVRQMRLLDVFNVGTASDGGPLEPPAFM